MTHDHLDSCTSDDDDGTLDWAIAHCPYCYVGHVCIEHAAQAREDRP